MSIEFVDPPAEKASPGPGGARFWAAVGDQLQQRRGEWAVVRRDISSTLGHALVHRIKSGSIIAMSDAKYDARYVETSKEPRRGDLYVRAMP